MCERLFNLIYKRSFKIGVFKLSSGKSSNMYFNMKSTMMLPEGASLIAKELIKIINKKKPDYVGGLEMGPVPMLGSLSALSWKTNNPIKTLFVRKESKQHGTSDLIEGLSYEESLADKSVLIIDDVATSGASMLKAATTIRDAGGNVKHAICLINRDEGARGMLKSNGIELYSIFQAYQFLCFYHHPIRKMYL